VKFSRKLRIGAALLGAGGIAALGALAGNGNAAHKAAVKVAIVADTGSLNDKGFNTLAVQGGNKAVAKLGVDLRVYPTATAADRTPNLQAAAQAGYGLVIANGVLFAFGPLNTVAPAFPKTKFAGTDVNIGDVTGKPANVLGIQFREQEAGCLVGNIAALEIKREHKKVISAVGANKVPAIVRYFAGYKYCAKRAYPQIKVLANYANDPTFEDQAKCKATTLGQLARGSRIVFMVAGACGLGGLDAVKKAGVWGIGVDADQYFLGSYILTSATKHVEISTYDVISDYVKDPAGFKTGFNRNFTLKNGGVGYGRLSSKLPKSAAASYRKSTNKLEKLIITGKVKPPAQ